LPRAPLNDLGAGLDYAKINEREPDKRSDLIQTSANRGVKLAGCPDEPEEPRRVSLIRGMGGERSELPRMILDSRNDERETMLGFARRRNDDLADERADQFPCRLVALDKVWRTSDSNSEYERHVSLVGAGRLDDEIIDRVFRRLLEVHTYDEPAVAQLGGPTTHE
jgi:hypothetical protein